MIIYYNVIYCIIYVHLLLLLLHSRMTNLEIVLTLIIKTPEALGTVRT